MCKAGLVGEWTNGERSIAGRPGAMAGAGPAAGACGNAIQTKWSFQRGGGQRPINGSVRLRVSRPRSWRRPTAEPFAGNLSARSPCFLSAESHRKASCKIPFLASWKPPPGGGELRSNDTSLEMNPPQKKWPSLRRLGWATRDERTRSSLWWPQRAWCLSHSRAPRGRSCRGSECGPTCRRRARAGG